MRNTRKLDLLTEVNTMRNMMGLKPINLLTEAVIPPKFLTAFAKTTTKLVGKTANDIASALGVTITKARSLKTMIDDFDVAIKAADNATAEALVRNIVGEFDNTTITNLATDLLSDTADDSLRGIITNNAQIMKARGVADDVIKAEIKKDLDILLTDLPDNLKNSLKNLSDDIVNTALAGTAKTTGTAITTNGVLRKLSQSPVWADLGSKLPAVRDRMITEIDTLIKAGAKSEDEVVSLIVKNAEDEMSVSFLTKWNAFKLKNKNLVKWGGRTLGYLIIPYIIMEIITRKATIPEHIGKKLCDWFVNEESDFMGCDELRALFEDAKNDSKSSNTTPVGDCPGNSQFVKEVKAAYGALYDPNKLDGFDDTTCTGTYDGEEYTWNGTSFGG